MPKDHPPEFDEEFDRSVAEWRDKHRLREDDAVMLLVELFRIHQRHWDEIRHRELPSFAEFKTDVGKLSEAARAIQIQSTALLDAIRKSPTRDNSGRITSAAAIIAALICLVAGYVTGRAWP